MRTERRVGYLSLFIFSGTCLFRCLPEPCAKHPLCQGGISVKGQLWMEEIHHYKFLPQLSTPRRFQPSHGHKNKLSAPVLKWWAKTQHNHAIPRRLTNCSLGEKAGRKPIRLHLANIYRGIAYNFSELFIYLINTKYRSCVSHITTRNKKIMLKKKRSLPSRSLQSHKKNKYLIIIIITWNLYQAPTMCRVVLSASYEWTRSVLTATWWGRHYFFIPILLTRKLSTEKLLLALSSCIHCFDKYSPTVF